MPATSGSPIEAPQGNDTCGEGSADCDATRARSTSLLVDRIDPPRVVAGDQLHDLVRLFHRAEILRDPAVEALLHAAAEQQLAEIVQLGQAERVGRIELLGELSHFQ